MPDDVAESAPGRPPSTAKTRLIRELQTLRNDRGVTIPRLAEHPTLLSFGSSWRRVGRLDADTDVAATVALLRTAIGELHARERDLLLAQFAFSHDQESREQREAAYLRHLQRTGGKGSLSSFERWSRVGIEQLADRIVDHVSGLPAAPGSSEQDAPATTTHEPYAVEEAIDRYRLLPGRIVRDLVSERVVRCLVPGDHLYLAHHVYYADQREGVLELEPEWGCEVVREFVESGLYYSTLEITKTLAVGETFRFAYRVHVRSDAACSPYISHADDVDFGKWRVDIEFARDAIPVQFWTFSHMAFIRSRVREFRRQVPRPHDGSRYFSETWTAVQRDRAYGLDWQWPDAEAAPLVPVQRASTEDSIEDIHSSC